MPQLIPQHLDVILDHLEVFSLITSALLLPLLYFRDGVDVLREYSKFCREISKEGYDKLSLEKRTALRDSIYIFKLETWYLGIVIMFLTMLFTGSQVWNLCPSAAPDFEFLDRDHDGNITLDEFQRGDFHFSPSQNGPEFDQFDTDNNHLISLVEYENEMKKLSKLGIITPRIWLYLNKRQRSIAAKIMLLGGLLMQGYFLIKIQICKRASLILMTDFSEELLALKVPSAA